MSLPHSLVFLFMVQGVYGQNWGVTYNPDSICVLKGSSVTMSCSYTYANDNTVERVFWTKHEVENPSDLSEDIDYKGRFHYLGDKRSSCTMKLINVTQTHSRRYRFRFITDKDRWLGQSGVRLSVTDLQVETPERVMEGDTVTLKCNTTCSLSNTPTFIWYKNGHDLTRTTMKNNELSLQSVSSEDRGSYMCAVQGHENLPSPAVTLNVIHPPRSTTVSVNASGEIVEGSSVTLTCSSDANPPQINYTWYKENVTSPVGYGQSYIINNIQSSNSGLYYCEAQNKHGSQKTTAVPITLKGCYLSTVTVPRYTYLLLQNCLYNDEPPRGLSDDTTSHEPDTQDDPANQDVSASQDDEVYANVSFSEPESSRRVSNIVNDDTYANM
ncbi:B-cell receptor CD22-like [Chanos chanos]|uniref:B-cell receptor CD22-like n=1 Tax=Chanos chanos TaxID=29144 RepID=A0A6J2VWZ8_CHACN|nr:B-cell receptor CD22-like [Chanos chanos]